MHDLRRIRNEATIERKDCDTRRQNISLFANDLNARLDSTFVVARRSPVPRPSVTSKFLFFFVVVVALRRSSSSKNVGK